MMGTMTLRKCGPDSDDVRDSTTHCHILIWRTWKLKVIRHVAQGHRAKLCFCAMDLMFL